MLVSISLANTELIGHILAMGRVGKGGEGGGEKGREEGRKEGVKACVLTIGISRA